MTCEVPCTAAAGRFMGKRFGVTSVFSPFQLLFLQRPLNPSLTHRSLWNLSLGFHPLPPFPSLPLLPCFLFWLSAQLLI